MTFDASFPRVMRPAFGPGLAAASAPAGNWWEAGGATGVMAAYQPIGAASLAASYSNIANPGTFDAATGVAPTFDAATGWTGDGTRYLLTNIVPTASDWTMIVRFSGMTGSRGMLIGEVAAGTYFAFGPLWYGYGARALWGGGEAYQWPEMTEGVMAISGPDLYVNGVYKTSVSSSWSGTPDDIALMAQDASAYGQNMYGNWLAGAIYNNSLTAGQHAAIYAAMAAL